MTQQKDSVDENEVFSVSHEKGTGGAEVKDGLRRADLKEDGKNHEKEPSVVVCTGVLGLEESGNR